MGLGGKPLMLKRNSDGVGKRVGQGPDSVSEPQDKEDGRIDAERYARIAALDTGQRIAPDECPLGDKRHR